MHVGARAVLFTTPTGPLRTYVLFLWQGVDLYLYHSFFVVVLAGFAIYVPGIIYLVLFNYQEDSLLQYLI